MEINTKAILSAVFLGNFAAILSATTLIIPLPYLIGAFQTDLSTTSLTVTLFSLATGLIAPATGYISNRFGIRPLFLVAISLFILTSLLCASANNIFLLITFRFLQGLMCGIIIPVTMTIIYQVTDTRNQAFALSLWSTSGVLAPAIGPTIAGIIIQYASWRWIFLMNVPILLIVLLISYTYLPKEESTAKSSLAFDSVGLILSVLGTSFILLSLSFSKDFGFLSIKTLSLLSVGIFLLSIFVRHEFKINFPLLDMNVFHYRSFSIASFANSFMTLILNCSIYLLPLYLQIVRGFSPIETGLIVLVGPVAVAITSPIVGKLYRRPLAKKLLISGTFSLGFGFVFLSQVDWIHSISFIVFAIVIMEIGMGTAKISATTYGMEILPFSLTAHGSAVISWIKQCSTSLAVSLITTLILLRTRYHLGDGDPQLDSQSYKAAYEAASIDIFQMAIAISVLFILILSIWMQPNSDDLPERLSQ